MQIPEALDLSIIPILGHNSKHKFPLVPMGMDAAAFCRSAKVRINLAEAWASSAQHISFKACDSWERKLISPSVIRSRLKRLQLWVNIIDIEIKILRFGTCFHDEGVQ